MTKIRLHTKKDDSKKGDELLMDVVRRAVGLLISLCGLAIGILGAVLLARSFTLATLLLHSLPLFAISFVLIIQGLATGRKLSWREAFDLFTDTLTFI